MRECAGEFYGFDAEKLTPIMARVGRRRMATRPSRLRTNAVCRRDIGFVGTFSRPIRAKPLWALPLVRTGFAGERSALRHALGRALQRPHSHQVVDRLGEGEHPTHPFGASVLRVRRIPRRCSRGCRAGQSEPPMAVRTYR